jgi:hypothetical protein
MKLDNLLFVGPFTQVRKYQEETDPEKKADLLQDIRALIQELKEEGKFDDAREIENAVAEA